MQQNKIIELNYLKRTKLTTKSTPAPMSEELQDAIQSLIHRLRELGPLQSA